MNASVLSISHLLAPSLLFLLNKTHMFSPCVDGFLAISTEDVLPFTLNLHTLYNSLAPIIDSTSIMSPLLVLTTALSVSMNGVHRLIASPSEPTNTPYMSDDFILPSLSKVVSVKTDLPYFFTDGCALLNEIDNVSIAMKEYNLFILISLIN